jgi:hypothetical protein
VRETYWTSLHPERKIRSSMMLTGNFSREHHLISTKLPRTNRRMIVWSWHTTPLCFTFTPNDKEGAAQNGIRCTIMVRLQSSHSCIATPRVEDLLHRFRSFSWSMPIPQFQASIPVAWTAAQTMYCYNLDIRLRSPVYMIWKHPLSFVHGLHYRQSLFPNPNSVYPLVSTTKPRGLFHFHDAP